MKHSRPNFFMVGAPKCGTTSMFEYLRTHPNVYMPHPSRKEPFYFCDDLIGAPRLGPHRCYEDLFRKAKNHHKIVGEASTWYLYSDVALKRIAEYSPDAKILAMLRNPVDAAYSLHSEALNGGNETVEEFEVAWSLQDERKEGRSIPESSFAPKMLLYREVYRLGFQLKRLLEQFPPAQVKIILFEDFASNTRETYLELLEFLGLPDDGREEFPRLNANKEYRIRSLGAMMSKTPWITGKIDQVYRLLGVERLGIMRMVMALNTKRSNRKPLRPEMRERLVDAFRGEISSLECLLDRDLSHWSTSSTGRQGQTQSIRAGAS